MMKLHDLANSKYPNGSEWRRWDLHVHTPESKLGSSFPGIAWEAYISELEKVAEQQNISVIGVTDYLTIDGYEKVYCTWKDRVKPRLRSIDLILPNIELRSLPPTKDGKALNIHIIVNPTDPDHIEKIKSSLQQLRFEYKEQTYGCVRHELIKFGKVLDSTLNDDAAYKLGIEQFKPSYEVIKRWHSSDRWLRENSLIGIANGKDGISGLPTDGFSATRDELLKFAHFIFSGNPNDREYYLGKKEGISSSKIIEMYGSLKPCVHGSDAHDLDKLFNPDESRYCWIKSDPTFEGLRQILWEPDARVHIGPTKPQPLDMSKVIESINISNSNGWFNQTKISLNSNLVAIIGEKGAGKTAIADLLGFASGVQNEVNSTSSFITKGRLHLRGMNVSLSWGGSSISSGTLLDKPHSVQRPLVRYLSQDFVERLCSDDHEGNELQQAIEEVVFARLDEVHKEGFSTFDELRKARESASQTEKDTIRGELASINREIDRLYAMLSLRPQKEATKKQTEGNIQDLKKLLPEATNAADQAVLKKLEDAQTQKVLIEKDIAKLSRDKRAIEEILTSYQTVKTRTTDDIKKLIDDSPSQISEYLLNLFQPTWNATVENELNNIISTISNTIRTRQGIDGSNTDETSPTLAQISATIKEHQDALTKDELNKKRLIDLQKQIASQEATLQRIANEIVDLDEKTSKLLKTKLKERNNLYLKYFEVLSKDETGLKELYAPMKEQLNISGAEMNFELLAGYHVDVKMWLDKSARFYDGRKGQASTKRDEIEKFVAENLAPAWKSGDLKLVKSAFEDFTDIINPVDFMNQTASPSLKMIDLFDWMYSLDHITTTYKIQYGGTSLEHLSPGTRGIALLVLYLLMDEDDRRPLIIDQPEGNLDNSSIYQQLVPYIRSAKEKRQIILVTHNPNLVVATDAEQIIIATAERLSNQQYPRITYSSGSLEHINDESDKLGTREAVCVLLEGGNEAFKEREGRYSLS